MASEDNTKGEENNSADLEEKSVVKEDVDEVEVEKGEERDENRIEEVGCEGTEENVHTKGNVDVGEGEEVKEKEQGKGGVEEDGKGNGAEEGGREETEEVKKEKKRRRKDSRKGSLNEELSSPRTPGTERPTRERKTVHRFTVSGTGRGSAAKPMTIEKGRGMQLKDIPNVAFKLSKRKADENLQLLHTILYGKKTKVHTLKKNIGLFSGFVWVENEEKQKTKVKERVDKCVKEKLLDFCDVLNIPIAKATLKKEELSAKLLNFLESPHATTDVLLAEMDKSKKRKSKDSASKTPPSTEVDEGKSGKKLKSDTKSGKKRKHLTEEEDNGKSESSQSENDQNDDNVADGAGNDQNQVKSEDETDEELDEPEKERDLEESSSKRSAKKDAGNKTSKKLESVTKISVQKASGTSGKSHKKSSSSKREKGVAEGNSKSKIKKPLSKKQRINKKAEEATTPAKNTSSSKGKVSKFSTKSVQKDQGKGKSSKNSRKEPTKEEMLSVVTDILKEVDFNTATLSDILRQLGKHFEVDLMHRKSEIKEIITEVINNMSDDDEDEAEESGDDAGKDIEDDDAGKDIEDDDA